MNIRELFSAKSIAAMHTEVASNKIAYLGSAFFPPQKKMGLDLKWIKTSKGLPVSLAASNFDAVSTLRSREGFKMAGTEMPFFRESMLVSERDEQEIMRVQESTDPYAQAVLQNIYNDAETLVEGAAVIPERMIMQLLAPADGSPKISFQSNGVTVAYNYDPNEEYKTNNFLEIATAADKWNVPTADPLKDVETARDAVEAKSGSRPKYMLLGKETLNYIKKCTAIQSAILSQNATANVMITDAKVKELFKTELEIEIIVYSKQFKNEAGQGQKFYPNGFATLLPEGSLGKTWFGTTPEERTLMGSGEADVAIVNTGVAVAVTTTSDPVNTKTTVSEIVLPSYERMDETYVIKAY